jgi:hypothetical protein
VRPSIDSLPPPRILDAVRASGAFYFDSVGLVKGKHRHAAGSGGRNVVFRTSRSIRQTTGLRIELGGRKTFAISMAAGA